MTIKNLITTQVLDISRGKPAHGIPVTLDHQSSPGAWNEIGRGLTDVDGRISTLYPDHARLARGVYRLTFETASYYQSVGIYSCYPHIPVVFEVQDGVTHHHVPLYLSPFGYSTTGGL
jgi:5-hydroxyisourate hydrolase